MMITFYYAFDGTGIILMIQSDEKRRRRCRMCGLSVEGILPLWCLGKVDYRVVDGLQDVTEG